MNEVFNFQENKIYSLWGGIHLASINMHTAHFGTDTISSLGHASTLSALLKPRLNLSPLTTAYVDYTKYFLRVLVLLNFV